MVSERFAEAVAYASRVHFSQVRKGSAAPYLSHLLGVASIALEHGADEEEAIAALLHDVVEDHGSAHKLSIAGLFGDRVLAIVEGCTDCEGEPKPPWRERKGRYIEHLDSAPASVHLVSASDKLHNLRSIRADYRSHGERLWKRFRGGREGTLWYYQSLVGSVRKAPPALLAILAAELAELLSAVERAGDIGT
jgi:GTP pyrophosphokinase